MTTFENTQSEPRQYRRAEIRRVAALGLVAIGAVVLVVALLQLGARSSSAARDLERLDALPAVPPNSAPAAPSAPTPSAPATTPAALHIPENGELLGRVTLPAHGVDVAIRHGATASVLRASAGHVPGTALPGSTIGNTVVTAHRDSHFRNLEQVRIGDRVVLEALVDGRRARLTYQITSVEIVDETALWVLDSSGEAQLTLLTCYPFDYVGRAKHRYVVRAVPAQENELPGIPVERVQTLGR